MASITLGGKPARTLGQLPAIGSKAPDFKLTDTEMNTRTLNDFKGHTLLLNIFPSVNTGVCSAALRRFNEEAAKLENTKVLCISKDLPFSQQQFCAAEGIENVVMLSDFKTGQFGVDYQVTAVGSAFDGLLSRAVVVVNPEGVVTYTEQVPEIGQEPDYESAIKAI